MFALKETQSFRFAAFIMCCVFLWVTVSLSFPETAYAQSSSDNPPQPSIPDTPTAQTDVPYVNPSVQPLDLSRVPTQNELMAAGQLGGQLYPTGDIPETPTGDTVTLLVEGQTRSLKRSEAQNLSFGQAIQRWNQHEYKKAVELLKKHIQEFPHSPWAAEAVLHLGCEARYNGRYTESETHFRNIIEQYQNNDHVGAKMLTNKARSRLAVQKVLQNNVTEALALFSTLKTESLDWRDRTYAAHWIQRLSKGKAEELALLNCGTQALAHILKKDGNERAARQVMEVIPETLYGQSVQDLKSLAQSYGYTVTGRRLEASDLTEIPLPTVVQIDGKQFGNRGHYWVLEQIDKQTLRLFDPQSGRRYHQQIKEFAEEWDGVALVFSDEDTLPGILLADNEMEQIYGGCCGVRRPEDQQGEPGRNEGPKSQDTGTEDPKVPDPQEPEEENKECGTPDWSVNMVNMNLHIKDVPLWNNSPIGPSVQVALSYNSQSATAQNEVFGNKWQFNYGSYLVVDPGGNVTIFMPDGRRDVFTPDGSGGYEKPYRVYNTLTKLAENHFQLRFPDDTVYIYNIPPATNSQQPFLVEIRDAHNQSVTLTYNANIQLTMITDALGKATTFTYNADGLITQTTGPHGRSATFVYDANRNLIRITDMGGYWTQLSYDEDVYLTSLENARGRWEFYIEPADGIRTLQGMDAYPPPGDPIWENYRITVTNPEGGKEEYHYNGYSGYSWYVSPRDYMEYVDYHTNNFRSSVPKIKYDFDKNYATGQGEIRRITYSEGGYISYEYDDNGNRTSVSDGDTVQFTYNDLGNITSITGAKGTVTTLNYAPNGIDLTSIVNGLGTVSMSYNSTHEIVSLTDRLNQTTNFSYNSYGQLTSMTDALNIVTNYTYGTDHHLQQVTRDGKALESYSYDPIGRVSTHTDETGLMLAYTYNNLNHVTQVAYPDGKSVNYEYSGCCPRLIDSVTDRAGRTTNFVYDANKRLLESINPEGGRTQYVRDANGNLHYLIDPNGNTTSFEYDLDNRVVKKIYDDESFVTYAYNNQGLLTTFTNARGTEISYAFDDNKNLTSVSYSDETPSVNFQYDEYNRMTQRQDGIGTYQFNYDANSQLVSADGPWENDTLTYQYDKLGRRTTLAPQGGESLAYSYDALNRLTDIQLSAGTYSYSYSGAASPLVQQITRPNGSKTTYQYDLLNRLTLLANTTSANALINSYAYTYNPQDVRGSETINNGTPITSFQNELISYNYNTVNQLTDSTNPDRTFTYDPDGNMTQGYTPEGYLFTAMYDAENRLKSVEYTDNGGILHKTAYQYSGDSLLATIEKYENNTLTDETRIVRNGFLAVQDRNGNNAVVREYTWGPNMGGGIGGLLNLKQGGQHYSYLYDGKGNVTALLDNTRSAIATYTYDTFGNLMSKAGTFEQPIQFSTKRYNEKAGFLYYGYRFASPGLGRWINRDPLGEEGGINLYEFAGSNPINFVDTEGESLLVIGAVVGFAVIAYGAYEAWDSLTENDKKYEDAKINRWEYTLQMADDDAEFDEEYYRQLQYEEQEALYDVGESVGEVGMATPGTSFSGPPPDPTSKLDLISTPIIGAIIDWIGGIGKDKDDTDCR